MLSYVNHKNAFALAGIINPEIIPEIRYDMRGVVLTDEEERRDWRAREGSIIEEYSGRAWKRATMIDKYLEYFLREHMVISVKEYNMAKLWFSGLYCQLSKGPTISGEEMAKLNMFNDFIT